MPYSGGAGHRIIRPTGACTRGIAQCLIRHHKPNANGSGSNQVPGFLVPSARVGRGIFPVASGPQAIDMVGGEVRWSGEARHLPRIGWH